MMAILGSSYSYYSTTCPFSVQQDKSCDYLRTEFKKLSQSLNKCVNDEKVECERAYKLLYTVDKLIERCRLSYLD